MKRLWNLDLDINLHAEKAVYIQIADAIIIAIKDKRLKSNEILPSTRKLAEHIGVNRNTLIKALDILIAEGWLISKDRVGIFVANVNIKSSKKNINKEENKQSFKKPQIILDDGAPNTKISPIKELASAYRRVFALKSRYNLMGYANTSGTCELRELISQMLNHKHGMQTNKDEICITRGSQMALYLSAHSLLKEGDSVLVETPGYQPAWEAFKSAKAKLIPVPVDQEGINVEQVAKLLSQHKNIKAIYLTPHHQYPTTVSLSLERRLQLIDLANKHNISIIEDDYDHEFHFDKRPIVPVSGYDALKNYVYIGSFSKIIAPSLRIGYMASSAEIIKKVASLRKIIDVQSDTIMELSLVELIKNGDVKRHIKRASKYYEEKRLFVHACLQKHLKNKIDYKLPNGGLAFWLVPKTKLSIQSLIEKLQQQGIELKEVSNYNGEEMNKGLRLGYGSLEKEDLEKLIISLRDIL